MDTCPVSHTISLVNIHCICRCSVQYCTFCDCSCVWIAVLPTIDDLQDVSVNSGETANFTCQFTKGDSNDVTTYWLVADVRYNCDISESDPIRCSTNETTSVLQIDDTTLFNNSEVQCKVQLPAEYINDESFLVEFNEEITRKATLTVLPAPSSEFIYNVLISCLCILVAPSKLSCLSSSVGRASV